MKYQYRHETIQASDEYNDGESITIPGDAKIIEEEIRQRATDTVIDIWIREPI